MNSLEQTSNTANKTKRLLKLLAKYQPSGLAYKKDNTSIQVMSGTKSFTFSADLFQTLKNEGKLHLGLQAVKITDNGMRYLKTLMEPDLGDPIPDRVTKTVEFNHDGAKTRGVKNVNESPLERLFHRKSKAGSTYISEFEFEAGERLRKDFERGQLQPKISATLSGAIGSAGRNSSSSSIDISDFALDARKRVEEAIDSLGPELSGVAVDICCFLKGLELVERERKWPPRSAKLMLKTGLSILARHYGLVGNFNNRRQKKSHWGSEGFRPAMIMQ